MSDAPEPRIATPSFDIDLMAGSTGGATFVRATVATAFDVTGKMVSVAANAIRFDYDPVTHAPLGYLLEEASTNSDTGLSRWTVSGATLTAASDIAPDGTNTMYRMADTATSGTHYAFNGATTTANVPYTFSIFAKAAEYQFIQVFYDDNAGNGVYATFDLVNGTISQPITSRGTGVVTGLAWIRSIGNGIWRCGVSAQTTVTTGRMGALMAQTGNPGWPSAYAGDPSKGVLVWGAQLESLPYPTSYIYTSGATFLRQREQFTWPIASVTGFDPTQGSLAVEYILEGTRVSFTSVANLVGTNVNTDGMSTGEFTTVGGSTAAAPLVSTANIFVGNVNSGHALYSPPIPIPAVVPHRSSISWATGGTVYAAHDGTPNATTFAVTALPTIVNLQISGLWHSQFQPSVWARRITYWPTALPQADLVQYTSMTKVVVTQDSQTLSAGDGPTFDVDLMTTLGPGAVFTRNLAAWSYDVTGTLVSTPANQPRWDYDPVTHAFRGLLLEDQAANNIVNSVGWTMAQTALTRIPNAGIAPDGTNTMSRFVDTAVNTIHYVSTGVTTLASWLYTYSIYAQAAEYRYLQLFIDNSGPTGGYATFDLLTGTITGPLTARGVALIGVATMQSVGNGIYRCSITANIDTGTAMRAGAVIVQSPNPGFGPAYPGDVTKGLLLWGPQLEGLPYPSSYIPTTAGAITRPHDALSYPIAAVTGFNPSIGALSFEYIIEGYRVEFSAPIQFVGTGTVSDYINVDQFTIVAPANSVAPTMGRALVRAGGVNQGAADYNTTVVQGGVVHRGAASWANNDITTAAHDGVTAPTTTGTTTVMPALVYLTISGVTNNQSPVSLWARHVRYWPRKLLPTEQTGETRPGALAVTQGAQTLSATARTHAIGQGRIGGAGSVRATAAVLASARSAILGMSGPVNYSPNPRGEGAVVGTPGTLPAGWALGVSTMTWSVVATGVDVDTGLPYTDIRFNGTSSQGYVIIWFNTVTNPTAPGSGNGVPWNESAYVAIAGGDFTNVTAFDLQVRSSTTGFNVVAFTPTATLTRYAGTWTTNASLSGMAGTVACYFTANQPIDITLRFGPQQLEIGPTATTQLYPPVGQPGWSSGGGVLANPALGNNAEIDGAGSVSASTTVMLAGAAEIDGAGLVRVNPTVANFAEIDGAGFVRASAIVRALAQAEIDGVGLLAPNPALMNNARLGGTGSVTASATKFSVATARIAGLGGTTNWVRNPRAEGVIPGTPGTPPTYWGVPVAAPGTTAQIVGSGVDGFGLPYLDIRVFGTTTGTPNGLALNFVMDGAQTIVAASGETWTASCWFQLMAGSLPYSGTVSLVTYLYNAANTIITYNCLTGSAFIPVSGPTPQRLVGTGVLTDPASARVQPACWVYYATTGQAVDFTLRISTPQLERGPLSDEIYPPVGTLISSTRALLAMPTTTMTAAAQIDGAGGTVIQAFPPNPVRIAGAGSVKAIASVAKPAFAQIDGLGGKTNWIRNPAADGAVIGSPGALPTFWSSPSLPGLTQDVVDFGVDPNTGVPYVDLRFHGTTFIDGNLLIYIEPANFPIVAPGDTFTTTAWFGVSAGDLTNIGAVYFTASISTGNITTTIMPSGSTFALWGGTGTAGVGATTIGLCYFQILVTTGSVDVTLRLGGFQLERGTTRTALILPPAGDPDISTRGLLAGPVVRTTDGATIAGQGWVFPGGSVRMLASARIDGRGNVGARIIVPGKADASVQIDGAGGVGAKPLLRNQVAAIIRGIGFAVGAPLGRVPAGTTHLTALGHVRATASVSQSAAVRIDGVGGRGSDPGIMRGAYARIAGAGSIGAVTHKARAAIARIAGVGSFTARVYRPIVGIHGDGNVHARAAVVLQALARIAGAGSFRGIAGQVTKAFAHTDIDGAGGVRATPRGIFQAHARIDGAGHIGSGLAAIDPTRVVIPGAGHFAGAARVIARIADILHGIGGVRAVATPVLRAQATIQGAGVVHASTTVLRMQQASVRINGAGRVRVSNAPNLITARASATIHGRGEVRIAIPPIRVVHVASIIHGAGRLRLTSIQLVARRAFALIQGRGAVRAQAVIHAAPRPVAPSIHGAGAVHVTARVAQRAVTITHGAGSVRVNPHVTKHVAASAAIHGTGLVRALGRARFQIRAAIHGIGQIKAVNAPNKVTRQASATIHGAGALHVNATIKATWHVSARINGAGGTRATARAILRTRATINGAATTRASIHALARARALIAGLGHLSVNAFKLPKFGTARIAGAGSVRAHAARVQPAGARINGRGGVKVTAGVSGHVRARIAGVAWMRIRPAVQMHVRVRIVGAGEVIADPDLKGVHHATARIAGQGGFKPDPYIPRDRVALYGVHLPGTKRGVSV